MSGVWRNYAAARDSAGWSWEDAQRAARESWDATKSKTKQTWDQVRATGGAGWLAGGVGESRVGADVGQGQLPGSPGNAANNNTGALPSG